MDVSSLQVFPLRLHPGDDLKLKLYEFTLEKQLKAGFVLTCVGSLQKAVLRFAGKDSGTVLEQKFEIVSLVGTLSADGVHLHVSVSDSEGNLKGGHLMEGSIIYTTAEITIGEIGGKEFHRDIDEETGYKELIIK